MGPGQTVRPFKETLAADEDLIGQEEGFRQIEAPVGGVVERALEKIEGAVVPGDAGQCRDLAGEAVNVFGSDGVALERHGAGPDLPGAERLAPFAERGRLKDAEVEGELVEAGAQPGEGIDDEPVLLARVGLGGGFVGGQVQLFHHPFFELTRRELAFGEQLGVAGAGPDRALHALAADDVAHALQLSEVGEQVLAVLGESVAHCGGFGGLDVGEGDSGRVGFVCDSCRQCGQRALQPFDDLVEARTQAQGVHVVEYIHRRGAEMDDRAANGALLGIGADLRHEVVTDLFLDLLGAFNVDVVLARAQIGHLHGCDQPGLVLSLCQRDPDAAHESTLFGLAPSPAHGLAAVAPGQRREVGLVGEGRHGRQWDERAERSEE